MKKILEITNQIKLQVDALKNSLKLKINSLPDNPNIQRLGGGCFTMNFSEIAKAPVHRMSPEFYDFKEQHKTLCDIIDNTEVTTLPEKLKSIIDTGKYRLKTRTTEYHFHPSVLKALSETLYETNTHGTDAQRCV